MTDTRLVAPRWSQAVRLHYKKRFPGVMEREARHRLLLFNIGRVVYACDPDIGIWRTQARLADIDDPDSLLQKPDHPEIEKPSHLELIPAGGLY